MTKIIKKIGLGLIIGSVFFTSSIIIKDEHEKTVYEEVIAEKISEPKSYYAILEISAINFKREIFAKESPKNNLNDNVILHAYSVLPNKSGPSNIILAGHSGFSSKAFFRNLHKLNKGDTIKFYYNNNIYIYKICDIEKQAKTGKLFLKNEYYDTITLITCTKNDSKSQTIYYGKLKNIEKIS